MRTALVGREREFAVLTDSLAQAMEGHPRVVLCRGEPGVGKTRLADELRRRASTQGVPCLWGRAEEPDSPPPYWPWQQVLRGVPTIADLSGTDEQSLSTDLGPLARHVFPRAAASAKGGSFVEDRLRQFDAVRHLLRLVSLQRPLLIVIDDAHGADEASLLLLRHITQGLTDERMLLLVNQRDTERAHHVLEVELLRQPITRQLVLRGLGATAVGEQLTSLLGHEVPDVEIAYVHSATGGNPFFVAEMGRMLEEGGRGARSVQVTTDVRDAIKARLQRRSPDCLRFLRAASVVGPDFELTVVAAMLGVAVLDCLDPLEEAVAAGLVEAASAVSRHRFTHAILRDAIEAGLTTGERVRLHHSAAEALEATYAGRVEPHLFDLARHWSMAWVLGDSARAARWIRRAGEEAMRDHGYEEGARLFRMALDVWAGAEDEIDRCRLLLDLGWALNFASDIPGALKACREASALAADLALPELVAEAALAVEPTMFPEADLAIRRLCEAAVRALGDEHTVLRVRVNARLAEICDNLGDVETARRASEEALALADRIGEVTALVAALHACQLANASPDNIDRRAALAERMLSLGRDTSDRSAQLWGRLWRIDVALERGELGVAARELDAALQCAEGVRARMARWQLLRCQAVLAQARARFEEARRLGAKAFSILAPTGNPLAYIVRTGLLSAMGHHVGYDAEAAAWSGFATGSDPPAFPTAGVIRALAPAWMLSEIGREDQAAAIYRSLGPVAEWRPTPHATLFAYAFGICVAKSLDASDDVAALHDLLNPYRGHHVVSGTCSVAYFGPVELWLGVAAAYLDQLDDAVVDLEEALKATGTNGAVGFELEAQIELADVLVRRSRPGDRARSRSLAAESARRAEALRMPPLAAKAERLIQGLDHRSSATLTPREREVAELVAQGLTNREIAGRLYLSERTAENHVQHILTKLDLSNRSQIATWSYARR
ncbi:MAG: AAA family ATPase [Actinomycetota bacterium]|nr:AAA family ATPase [Actinomycetota bacterium]